MFTCAPAINSELWGREEVKRLGGMKGTRVNSWIWLPCQMVATAAERRLRGNISTEILLFHSVLTTEWVWQCVCVCVCAGNTQGRAHKELSYGTFIYSIQGSSWRGDLKTRAQMFPVSWWVITSSVLGPEVASFHCRLRYEWKMIPWFFFTPGLLFEWRKQMRRSHNTSARFQTSLTRLAEGGGGQSSEAALNFLLLLMFPHQFQPCCRPRAPSPFLLDSRMMSGWTSNAAANRAFFFSSGSLCHALFCWITQIHRSQWMTHCCCSQGRFSPCLLWEDSSVF